MAETPKEPKQEAKATAAPTSPNTTKSGGKLPIIIVAVAAVTILVVGVGGYIGYKTFFYTPSPSQVCEKLRDLMIDKYKDEMKSSDDEAKNIVDEILGPASECEKEEEESRKDMSASEVREYTNCIMDAKTFDDLEGCDIDRD